jgi:hypothetical protein
MNPQRISIILINQLYNNSDVNNEKDFPFHRDFAMEWIVNNHPQNPWDESDSFSNFSARATSIPNTQKMTLNPHPNRL